MCACVFGKDRRVFVINNNTNIKLMSDVKKFKETVV